MNREGEMGKGWWTHFGFKKNPYGTGALFAEDGEALLVDRDSEVNMLKQVFLEDEPENPKIAVLKGAFGVGKTSILNVVAYKLRAENGHFFLLEVECDSINNLDSGSLYKQILKILLDNWRFMVHQGVSLIEIGIVYLFFGSLLAVRGIGPIEVEKENARADQILYIVVNKWLTKCFYSEQPSGIICIIDNLESKGSPDEVGLFLVHSRDTFFRIPGLKWALCGTPNVITPAITNRQLDGYIKEIEIHPIEEDAAPEIVLRRINRFTQRENADAPVNGTQFKEVYTDVTKNNLRTALSICNSFALYLYRHPELKDNDRTDELRSWLFRKAGEYELEEIPDASWELFDYLTNGLDGEATGEGLVKRVGDIEQIQRISKPLNKAGLVSVDYPDTGLILRTSEKGFLLNYRKQRMAQQ